jgi:hypothetical protein
MMLAQTIATQKKASTRVLDGPANKLSTEYPAQPLFVVPSDNLESDADQWAAFEVTPLTAPGQTITVAEEFWSKDFVETFRLLGYIDEKLIGRNGSWKLGEVRQHLRTCACDCPRADTLCSAALLAVSLRGHSSACCDRPCRRLTRPCSSLARLRNPRLPSTA